MCPVHLSEALVACFSGYCTTLLGGPGRISLPHDWVWDYCQDICGVLPLLIQVRSDLILTWLAKKTRLVVILWAFLDQVFDLKFLCFISIILTISRQ